MTNALCKEIVRSWVLLFVIVLCLAKGGFSAAAQEPAQTQQGVITTFAPTVEKVAPSVVTVFTTQTVSRGLSAFPFSDDTLRQFFGGNLHRGKANKRCKASARG